MTYLGFSGNPVFLYVFFEAREYYHYPLNILFYEC
jgi:hypothetical protein